MRYLLVGLIAVSLNISIFAETASWYGKGFEGKLTASGYKFDSKQLTCASNDYPFGTVLKVTNKKNKKSVVVVVTDRGGFKKYGRAIDLSHTAFDKIANNGHGLIDVDIEVLSKKNTFKYKHGEPKFTKKEYNKYVKDI